MRGLLFPSAGFSLLLTVALAALPVSVPAAGATIDHSKITEVVNSVSIITPKTLAAAPARQSEMFRSPDIMKTGPQSRSEMVADDQTITRVGANTLFSFEPRQRVIDLKQGSVLFQSPHGMGGGEIKTDSATASVLGTTIIVVATRDGGFKLLVLEGTGYVKMPNGKHTILHGGQLVYIPPGGKDIGPILNFRLSEEVKSGRLVDGFHRPLPSWPKIVAQIQKQEAEIASGQFQNGGMVIGNSADPNTTINHIQSLHLTVPLAAPGPAASLPVPQPTPAGKRGGGGTTTPGGKP